MRVAELSGPRAGLLALRPLLALADLPAQQAIALHCLRFAYAAGDWIAWQELLRLWSTLRDPPMQPHPPKQPPPEASGLAHNQVQSALIRLIRDLRRSFPQAALDLAQHEHERHAGAEIEYVLGWLKARAGIQGAAAHFEQAATLPHAQAALRARARFNAMVLGFANPVRARVSLAAAQTALQPAHAAALSAEDRKQLITPLLASDSRFARAEGLQLLVQLAASVRDADRSVAYLTGAEFVDAYAERMTALEWDRLAALFARVVPESLRLRALLRLAAIREWVQGGAALEAGRVGKMLANAPELGPAIHAARAHAENAGTLHTLRNVPAATTFGATSTKPAGVVELSWHVIAYCERGGWEHAESCLRVLAALPDAEFAHADSRVLHAAIAQATSAQAAALHAPLLALLTRLTTNPGPRVAPPRMGYVEFAAQLSAQPGMPAQIRQQLHWLGVKHAEIAAARSLFADVLRDAKAASFARDHAKVAAGLAQARALAAELG